MAGARSTTGVTDNSITALLAQLSEGKREAEARLIPRIYKELRRRAAHYMRLERVDHTLQPTVALVLHVSERTAKRDWNMAQTWLKRELSMQP
jgi:hypothetical protein